MKSQQSSEECGGTSGASLGQKISSQVLQLLEQKTQMKESFSCTFKSLDGFIYSSGGDSGFNSRYLSLAWTESFGEHYLHVGRLGAAPT